MTQVKHTPGPWVITDKWEVGKISTAWDQSLGMVVPHCNVYGENKEANALLIANAPDLLEVLEEAREHIAYSAPQWHYRTQEIIAKIDAAIAKAKGYK